MEKRYLVQLAIDGVVDHLNNSCLPSKLGRSTDGRQAEVANTRRIDDRHEIREVVRFLGVGGGSNLPLALRVGVLDMDGELIDLNLRTTAVDGHRNAAAWGCWLAVIIEAGGRGPVKYEVGGGDARGRESE